MKKKVKKKEKVSALDKFTAPTPSKTAQATASNANPGDYKFKPKFLKK